MKAPASGFPMKNKESLPNFVPLCKMWWVITWIPQKSSSPRKKGVFFEELAAA